MNIKQSNNNNKNNKAEQKAKTIWMCKYDSS